MSALSFGIFVYFIQELTTELSFSRGSFDTAVAGGIFFSL